MRFAPREAHPDCAPSTADLDQAGLDQAGLDQAVVKLTEQAIPLLHHLGYVVFRIGRLRLGEADSRAIAWALAEAMRDALVADGAPAELRLEFDAAQVTYVPDGFPHRTLLPHHDGQHCSYLTPSRLDDPDWDPAGREFGRSGYTTTPAHKMYQGVFIADPGEALSVTTYYDWLDVVRTVHQSQAGQRSADPAVTAAWLGTNLRRALHRQVEHGCPYPSFGGMLGLDDPLWNELSFHHAEAPLSAADRTAHPAAVELAARCPCGDCAGETARLFCHQMLAATGHTWREFRRRWEILVPSERYDLIVGQNLTMLHGGLAGGTGRVIEPMCLVVDDPRGPDYERWLAAEWRRR
jgi:hypothetical protein